MSLPKPGIATSVSRGIESFSNAPPPARSTMIESARAPVAQSSVASPVAAASTHSSDSACSADANSVSRTSVPSTRMFWGKTAISGLLDSVSPMSVSFDFWIVAETANATRLRRSQPKSPKPIHLSHGRPSSSGFGGLGGRSSRGPGSRLTFSRNEARSGLPSRGPRRAR